MDEQMRNDALGKLPSDEKELTDFLIKGSFAIIAASWIIINYSDVNNWLFASIFTAILALLMIGLKWTLRLRHYHKIIDATEDNLRAYPDFKYSRTWYGRMAERLHYIPPILILAGAALFLIGCVIALIK